MRHRRPKVGATHFQHFRSAATLPESWDTLLPDGHFLKKDSLRLYEEAALPDVSFSYVLALNGNTPLVAAYFQTLSIREKHLNAEALKPWQRRAWRMFTATTCPRLLVSGHLFRHDVRALYRHPDLEIFEAFKIFRTAMEVAAKKAGAAAVLVKDPPDSMLTYFQQFAPEYLLMRADVSMEVEMRSEWQTFDDYEKALKHKYAQRVRNVRKAAAGLHFRELESAEVEARKDELHSLYRQVTERQPVRLGFLSAGLLPMLKRAHPELLVWGIFEGEKLVGFASGWTRADTFDMFYIGFDYTENARLQLYFNILFFAVEQAISLRAAHLILGRTALEAKARLGCRPRYLQTFLYVRNPVLRAWVARMQGRFAAGEGEWESRHPFKV